MPTETFSLSLDGNVRGIDDGNEIEVQDNAYDWLLFENDVMPYADIFELYISGALVTRYEPNTMLINTGDESTADSGDTTWIVDATLTQGDDYWNGARLYIISTTDGNAPEGEYSVITDFDAASDNLTFTALTAAVDVGDNYTINFFTIPDREAAGNDARGTWGYNETMTITYGVMESSESTEPSGDLTGGFDMPSVSLPSHWFVTGANLTGLPFYDAFSEAAAADGQPVQVKYFIAIIGLAFGTFIVLMIWVKSALLGAVGMNFVFLVGGMMSIVPLWIPFAIIIAQVFVMYLYKQTSY